VSHVKESTLVTKKGSWCCADEKYDVDLAEKKPFIKAVAIGYCQQKNPRAEEEEQE